MDAKSIECVFVVYCDYHKAYTLFHPSSHRLIASRYVVFNENTNISNKLNNSDEKKISDDNVKIEKIVKKVQEQQHVLEQKQVQEQGDNMSDTTSNEETTEGRRIMDGTPTGTIVPRRSSHQTHPPVKFRDYA